MLITTFCKQNSVRFYPLNQAASPQYTFVHFDADSFENTIQNWQMKVEYTQKAYFEDRLTVLVHTQSNGGSPAAYPPKLYMLDHNKNLLHDLNFSPHYLGTQTPSFDIYTDPVSSTTYPMNCSLWSFSFGEWLHPATDSGIYYLQFSNYASGSSVVTFLSEPIFLSNDTDRTLYFEYSNNSNKNDVIINGWASSYFPVFRSRMEADIRDYKPFGISIGYNEQDYLQLQQYGQSWRTWLLRLGSNTMGVPAYMLERAATIFNCDNVLIDGKAFVFDNQGGNGNASPSGFWKVNDSVTSPLLHADLPIREKYASENTIVNTSIEIFTVPGTPDASTGLWSLSVPFALCGFQLFSGVSYATCTQFVFRDTADITNFLNYLNSTFAVFNSMSGTFAYSTTSGIFSYNNVPGETWSMFAFNGILTGFLNLPIDVTTSGDSWAYGIHTPGGAVVVMDWGDNNTFPYDTALYSYGSSGTYAPAKTYTGTGIFCPFMFFNDAITSLLFLDATVKITLSAMYNITGGMPPALTHLSLINQELAITEANIPIATCAATLQNLGIDDCNAQGFANDLFGTGNYASLSYIALTGNNIDTSKVDAMFNAFEAHSIYVAGGTFNTSGQTPPAPPSIVSILSRNFLGFAGWTIITD